MPEGAKYCIACGAKIDSVAGKTQVYYYDDNDGKLGRNREKAKNKKGGCINFLLMIFCVLITLVIVIFVFMPADEEPESQPVEQSAEEEINEEESDQKAEDAYFAENDKNLANLDEIDMRISDVLVDAGYTVDHATAIQEILNTIGIDSIEIETISGEAESGVNAVICYPNGLTDRDRRFYFTTEDGVTFYAGFLGEDLYDSAKGGFLKNYNDVHVPEKEVTSDEFVELQLMSEDVVKQYLNYPSTANFDVLSYRVGRRDDHYQITGSVNAQNGFGVEDKLPFSVWFVKEDGKFIIEGVSLKGVRVK